MTDKPTYEELKDRIQVLEKAVLEYKLNNKVQRKHQYLINTIFDSTSTPFVLKDINCTYTTVNKAFCKFIGKKEEEIIGKTDYDLFPAEEAEKYIISDKAVISGGSQQKKEWSVERKSGPKWLKVVKTPVINNKGECSGVLCTVSDISHIVKANMALKEQAENLEKKIEQRTSELRTINDQLKQEIRKLKKAEEALRKSETLLNNILESMSDGVLVLDENFHYVFWNRAMENISNVQREKLIGSDLRPWDIFPHLKDQGVADMMRGAMAGDIQTREAIPYCLPDGTEGVTSEIYLPLRHKSDRFRGVVGVIRDITEHKQVEAELRESEGKLSAMLASLTDHASMMDRELNILWVNETARNVFGKDLVGKKCYKAFHGIESPCEPHPCIALKVFEDGLPHSHETEIIDKDGQTRNFYCTANVALRDENNNPTAVMEISRDITARKQAEKEKARFEAKYRQAQKMESLGLLAGGVAHDLNNVLSGIVSYPELILLDLPSDSDLRKPLEAVMESGIRAANVVQEMLTIARGAATTKTPLNLNSQVDEYLNSPELKKLKQLYPEVIYKTNLDNDLLNINASSVHIRKVVMNLVANASEAIKGPGNVTISTVNRYVDRPLKGYDEVSIGEYAVLTVSDDGPGILPGDLERIFEPFYTKKVMGRSGTGLGLSVVWNVIQDHNGYINVITGENGTTFDLYFPITRDSIWKKDIPIPLKDYKGHGEMILVVDDEESQREIHCKMLDILGYKSKAIHSGEEAIEYLSKHTTDLLLLDMIMAPGINGRETYERIVKIHPKQKAIIVSGFSESDDVKEIQKFGAGQYVKKPLTFEKLGLAVKKELEK